MRTVNRSPRLLPSTGPGQNREFSLFILCNVFMGLASCINASVFNNYLKSIFDLDVAQRTFLEFPRELPGFLVSLFVASLALLGEVRIAMAANLLAAAGMLALGWIPASFPLMVSALFIANSGTHIYMPLSSSIGMSFARGRDEGRVLGRIGAINTVAVLSGSLALLAALHFFKISFRLAYSVSAAFYLASAMCFLAMDPRRGERKPTRLVLRKEYGRYYALAMLYGARKQLFITFAPWMLVDFFGASVEAMTLLGFLIAVVGIFAQPLVGRLTDRCGARAVIRGEAILMVAICAAYALAPTLFPRPVAFLAVAACYIVDQSASAVTMARAVYAKELVRNADELASTLSMDISLDHAVTMFLPALGGLLWRSGGAVGYRYVFLGGAVIAAANFAVASGIGRESERRPASG